MLNYRRMHWLFSILCVLSILGAAPLDAADDETGQGAKKRIAFEVPLRGAPKMRVGGGVRGVDSMNLTLRVLAPEESGFTTSSRPTLYWYVSDVVSDPVEIAITDTTSLEAASRPILEITLASPIEQGVHALSLADHGAALKSGVEYQWFVAIVTDPEQRSKDVIAGGSIVYSDGNPALQKELAGRDDTIPAVVYAQFGLWYDAVHDLSQRIVRNPGDAQTRELRADLLEQVGLGEVAAYDRSGLL